MQVEELEEGNRKRRKIIGELRAELVDVNERLRKLMIEYERMKLKKNR